MDSIRMLHVEDDPTDRELAREFFGRYAPHLKLTTVATVAEAEERLAVGDVDLVLADYRLPDGTGLTLLEMINAKGLALPVVLLTGTAEPETMVRLLRAGAAEYVLKRGNYLATLPRILEDALRWHRSSQELRQRPIRLLYAEDDWSDVELTQRAFKNWGLAFRLDAVRRGAEALERLRSTPYDLVLLDMRLIDMTGIEVLKALREDGIRVPVVAVTGLADEEMAVQAFKLGVADYVVKRQQYLSELPSTLERVLAQRRLIADNEALVVLNELAKSIATVQDPTEVAQQVARGARNLLKAETSVLWLVEGEQAQPAAWTGIEESTARALGFPVDARVLERANAERRLDLDLLASLGPWPAAFGERGYSLIVPLVTAGRFSGALGVAGQVPRRFTAAEERLLVALADHGAIALDNAGLYQQLRTQFATLERTQAQLVQAEKLASMGSLLANVAHELNNPLTVVVARAARLHQMATHDEVREEVESLQRATQRCSQIVRSFLALAHRQVPQRELVSLAAIVREAVELLTGPLRADDVMVKLDLEADLPEIWGDRSQLHQVVVNLVTNAQQAMLETALPRRLTLTTRSVPARQCVRLEVADTGPGLAPGGRERIFEPFFTTKPVGQGTGLGLAICRGIVEVHHGSISLESPPGQGARFVVELPIDARRNVRPVPSRPPSTPVRRTATILLVDDEPGIVPELGRVLIADGHRVALAADGLSALDKLRHDDYDLIFCDIHTAPMDAREFYRQLDLDHCRGLTSRVVFITDDTLPDETQHFLEETQVHRLRKPFDVGRVGEVVQSLLAAASAQRARGSGDTPPDRPHRGE